MIHDIQIDGKGRKGNRNIKKKKTENRGENKRKPTSHQITEPRGKGGCGANFLRYGEL